MGREIWERLAAIERAMRSASNWEEFEDALVEAQRVVGERNGLIWFFPEEDWRDWEEDLTDGEFDDPMWSYLDDEGDCDFYFYGVPSGADPESPFDPLEILSGSGDGDYTMWTAAAQRTPLPEVVVEAFGVMRGSSIRGTWIEFYADELEEIKEALRVAGFQVVAEVGVDGRPL